ncbi:MAG: F0F1 ATP synthase subunit A [Thermogutta sp.]
MNIAVAGEHVKDATAFHLPFGIHIDLPLINLGTIRVPSDAIPFGLGGTPSGVLEIPLRFQMTKFMAVELAIAVLMFVVFVPVAWQLRGGRPPRGRLTTLFDVILCYIRDQVAKPAIGEHEASRFLPFLWNLFFFILFANLMGLLPWAGSPTGSLSVTAVLALMTFGAVIGAGIQEHGFFGFFKGLVPHMDLQGGLGIVLKLMLWVIEVVGLCIKHAVLAVRLMANMFAGHLVLAVILSFIGAVASMWTILWFGVTIASVAGQVALMMLELFVAFLQAYIFTFLAALFIGMSVHQH